MEIVANYLVKNTTKVVRVLSGASVLSQVLIYPKGSKIVGYDKIISKKEAINITGFMDMFK